MALLALRNKEMPFIVPCLEDKATLEQFSKDSPTSDGMAISFLKTPQHPMEWPSVF